MVYFPCDDIVLALHKKKTSHYFGRRKNGLQRVELRSDSPHTLSATPFSPIFGATPIILSAIPDFGVPALSILQIGISCTFMSLITSVRPNPGRHTQKSKVRCGAKEIAPHLFRNTSYAPFCSLRFSLSVSLSFFSFYLSISHYLSTYPSISVSQFFLLEKKKTCRTPSLILS